MRRPPSSPAIPTRCATPPARARTAPGARPGKSLRLNAFDGPIGRQVTALEHRAVKGLGGYSLIDQRIAAGALVARRGRVLLGDIVGLRGDDAVAAVAEIGDTRADAKAVAAGQRQHGHDK